jgi:3-isopropylmalate dehydrogenase
MMLRMSFDMHTAAERIERAVRRVLASGYRTADIAEAGTKQVGTAQMGDLVVAALS